MKRFFWFLVILVLAGGGVSYWYAQASAGQGTSFRTAVVERGNLSATISATGTIEPEEVVDVGAQVAGMIKNFGRDPRDAHKVIDYGTPVEEGTVLAQIDDSLYKTQVDQAQAAVQRAEAELLQMHAKNFQAERDWNRAQKLGTAKGVISGLDYDTAQAAYETNKASLAVGQAAVAQAKATLKQATINLGYTTISSPVKGVIVDRRVNVGQTVVSSLNAPSLFLIAKDLKRMQIWASVNEADIGQIHSNQPVRFSVDAYPNEVFPGEVAQVRLNATMTQNVVTYTVVVNTDNSSGKLLPYLTANLLFEVSQRKDVLLVPNTALKWRPTIQQVAPDARAGFAKAMQRKENATKAAGDAEQSTKGVVWIEDEGFVRPVKVKIGLTDGTQTEIVEGELKENTPVVVGVHAKQSESTSTNPFTPQMFGGGKKS